MKLPNLAQATAFGRHVVSYSMGVVTTAALFHVIGNGDAANATNAITQISSGVAQIAAGVSTLVAIGSGIWAAISASPFRQLLSVAANPDVKQVVVATPAVADAVPSDKVVAK